MKLALKATGENSFDLICDMGFNQDLGVHNTRTPQTHSRCDPRVKEMVLFIKWWAKRRHINSPYRGTVSSYGYVLMIIHFLINVVDPPVLIKRQNIGIPEDAPPDQIFVEGGEGSIMFGMLKISKIFPRPRTKCLSASSDIASSNTIHIGSNGEERSSSSGPNAAY
ncbi:unnamed protein product [Tuber aestivum]|uniref:Polynucleotide adenylyltransferase n=1 Tax=Tuber aestivum TaxID=59557 RepID=A0A292PMD0_9PEZI|nr:unnamed protein product [Tuber aestivum]